MLQQIKYWFIFFQENVNMRFRKQVAMEHHLAAQPAVFLKLIWPAAPFSAKKILIIPPPKNLSLPSSRIVVMRLLNRKISNYLLKSTVVRFSVQTKKYNNE